MGYKLKRNKGEGVLDVRTTTKQGERRIGNMGNELQKKLAPGQKGEKVDQTGVGEGKRKKCLNGRGKAWRIPRRVWTEMPKVRG